MSEKHIDNKANDEKTEALESRRKVLKKILIGSGAAAVASVLPNQWIRPMINSVGPSVAYASVTTTSAPKVKTPKNQQTVTSSSKGTINKAGNVILNNRSGGNNPNFMPKRGNKN